MRATIARYRRCSTVTERCSLQVPPGAVLAEQLAKLRVADAAPCLQRQIGEMHELVDLCLEPHVVEPEHRDQQLAP